MTTSHREIELKYRLQGRAAHAALCRALGSPLSESTQVNHYFRSPDGRVPGDRGVVRIRVEAGRAVLTVKLGGPLRSGLVSSVEHEEPWAGPPEAISTGAAQILRHARTRAVRALREAFGGPCELEWAGSMTNLRRVYPGPEGLCLEVDASRYACGAEDFEVEVETDDPERDRPRLEALLAGLGLRCAPQTETKYQRFLRHAGL